MLAPFRDEYDRAALRAKIADLPPTVCRRVIREALTLYALLREPTTPVWAKAAIVGALGYFVCPLDGMPDVSRPAG